MPSRLLASLERYFEFERLGTNWRTEILGGTTTFVSMAYIVFVNPSILQAAGMPISAVAVATCLSAAFGCLLMGFYARHPLALAPGMGLNAYFTYTVVLGMGIPWQTALGAVFISGVAFVMLTLLGVRQWIVSAIPKELYSAVAAGIGLFVAFVGLRNAGLVVNDDATFVAMGNLAQPATALAALGIVLIAVFQAWNWRGAILAGILATTGLGLITGVVTWQPQPLNLSDLNATIFQLDVPAAAGIGLLDIVFVFFFVDLFDTVGTLVAVTTRAGLVDENHNIPRLNRILFSDAVATVVGALFGTSTVSSYVESAAGVATGARTGASAVTVGILFILALFLTPVIGVLPASATAPALVVVGGLMLSGLGEIAWDDPVIAVPAFLTLLTIPLTFSIANGLSFGIVSHVMLRLARGQARQIPQAAYFLAVLLILRFAYIGASA